MDDIYEKEVRFDLYCEKCKHWALEDQREPCCECLEHTINEATDKPVKFEEKKK